MDGASAAPQVSAAGVTPAREAIEGFKLGSAGPSGGTTLAGQPENSGDSALPAPPSPLDEDDAEVAQLRAADGDDNCDDDDDGMALEIDEDEYDEDEGMQARALPPAKVANADLMDEGERETPEERPPSDSSSNIPALATDFDTPPRSPDLPVREAPPPEVKVEEVEEDAAPGPDEEGDRPAPPAPPASPPPAPPKPDAPTPPPEARPEEKEKEPEEDLGGRWVEELSANRWVDVAPGVRFLIPPLFDDLYEDGVTRIGERYEVEEFFRTKFQGPNREADISNAIRLAEKRAAKLRLRDPKFRVEGLHTHPAAYGGRPQAAAGPKEKRRPPKGGQAHLKREPHEEALAPLAVPGLPPDDELDDPERVAEILRMGPEYAEELDRLRRARRHLSRVGLWNWAPPRAARKSAGKRARDPSLGFGFEGEEDRGVEPGEGQFEESAPRAEPDDDRDPSFDPGAVRLLAQDGQPNARKRRAALRTRYDGNDTVRTADGRVQCPKCFQPFDPRGIIIHSRQCSGPPDVEGSPAPRKPPAKGRRSKASAPDSASESMPTPIPTPTLSRRALLAETLPLPPPPILSPEEEALLEQQRLEAEEAKRVKQEAKKAKRTEKEALGRRQKHWSNRVSKEAPRQQRTMQMGHAAHLKFCRSLAVQAQKEFRRRATRWQKGVKEAGNRARRCAREMQVFWRKHEREIAERARRAEREQAEQRRREEEQREARRQHRKLNFLLQQTELFSHFMAKKMSGFKEHFDKAKEGGAEPPAAASSSSAAAAAPEPQALSPEPAAVPAPAPVQLSAADLEEMDEGEREAHEKAMEKTMAAIDAHKRSVQANDEDYLARRRANEVAHAKHRASLHGHAPANGEAAAGGGEQRSIADVAAKMDEEGMFNNPSTMPGDVVVKQPRSLSATLKEYQLKGLNWLVNLYEQGINGILADEMGLGKTVQSLSLLCYLSEKDIWGPFLVVAPASTLHNWRNEIVKFCPQFKVLPYWGGIKDRKVLRKHFSAKSLYTRDSDFHVLVTSYQLLVQDEKYFHRVKWQYMVLDEAQALKSSSSLRWKSLLSFNCRNRLLLTGTPIQNSMTELWALLHFIMPTFFDSHGEFNEWFSKDIESNAASGGSLNEHQLSRLHMILKPFMLRRVKRDVENEMAEKVEVEVACGLSARQRALYAAVKSKISIADIIEVTTTEKRAKMDSLMNLVMQLRKVCNHPELFERRSVRSPYLFQRAPPLAPPAPFGGAQEVPCVNVSPLCLPLPSILVWERSPYDDSPFVGRRPLGPRPAGETAEGRRKREEGVHRGDPLRQLSQLLRIVFCAAHVHSRTGRTLKVDGAEVAQANERQFDTGFSFARLLGLSPAEVERCAPPDAAFARAAAARRSAETERRRAAVYGPRRPRELLLPLPPSDLPGGLVQDPSDRLASYTVFPGSDSRDEVEALRERGTSGRGVVRAAWCYLPEALAPPAELACASRRFLNEAAGQTSRAVARSLLLGADCRRWCPADVTAVPHWSRPDALTSYQARRGGLLHPPDPFSLGADELGIESGRGLLEPTLRTFGSSHIQVPSFGKLLSDSGKLIELYTLLQKLKSQGHRCLIFSQMTKMIDILEEFMVFCKHKYLRLDGSSNIADRRDMVADFQTKSDIFCFLLSTRAGGLGINLTAADTVIFYDSDWNPTIDAQAMDRAHRLGQTKQVTVYRLVSKGTVEERILQRARQKHNIQQVVIAGGEFKQEADSLKPQEVASLLLDDADLERRLQQQREAASSFGGRRGRRGPSVLSEEAGSGSEAAGPTAGPSSAAPPTAAGPSTGPEPPGGLPTGGLFGGFGRGKAKGTPKPRKPKASPKDGAAAAAAGGGPGAPAGSEAGEGSVAGSDAPASGAKKKKPARPKGAAAAAAAAGGDGDGAAAAAAAAGGAPGEPSGATAPAKPKKPRPPKKPKEPKEAKEEVLPGPVPLGGPTPISAAGGDGSAPPKPKKARPKKKPKLEGPAVDPGPSPVPLVPLGESPAPAEAAPRKKPPKKKKRPEGDEDEEGAGPPPADGDAGGGEGGPDAADKPKKPKKPRPKKPKLEGGAGPEPGGFPGPPAFPSPFGMYPPPLAGWQQPGGVSPGPAFAPFSPFGPPGLFGGPAPDWRGPQPPAMLGPPGSMAPPPFRPFPRFPQPPVE